MQSLTIQQSVKRGVHKRVRAHVVSDSAVNEREESRVLVDLHECNTTRLIQLYIHTCT
jgi:hypothetical protein